ncbi:MAG: AAA family ATPase, partial [Polyangiales bacterium]
MLVRRIAVSGGPGAGKTTLWRSLAAAHPALLLPVPEVATLLLSHVFPAVQNESERGAVQRAIFAVQHNLEQVYESRASGNQVLLCDRGSPDGAGYWPAGPDHFFGSMQTAWQVEVSRYDAVVFMESGAGGGVWIAGGKVVRTQNIAPPPSQDPHIP